jgi:hypothetical protein
MTIHARRTPGRTRGAGRLHAVTHRRGLAIAALRPDGELLALNGERLLTPGSRQAVHAVPAGGPN